MDLYDSDSSDKDAEFPSNDLNYENYKYSQQFLIVDHTANQCKGIEISKIWYHGRKRHWVDDSSMDWYWQYSYYSHKRILKCPETRKGATSYLVCHLKNYHHIDINIDYQALPLQPISFLGTIAEAMAGTATSAITQIAGKIISTINIDCFWYLLI